MGSSFLCFPKWFQSYYNALNSLIYLLLLEEMPLLPYNKFPYVFESFLKSIISLNLFSEIYFLLIKCFHDYSFII